MIEDDEFLIESEDTVPDSVMSKSESVIDFDTSMHICGGRAMFETLCTNEDLGNYHKIGFEVN